MSTYEDIFEGLSHDTHTQLKQHSTCPRKAMDHKSYFQQVHAAAISKHHTHTE